MASEESSNHLVVTKSQMVLVKPSKPTPNVSLSLSTIDNDPFFEKFDQAISVFTPKPYGDGQTNHGDAASRLLQHALSNALAFYYPLAGKIHRRSEDNRLELNCKDGDGVPFTRATTTCTLSSLNYLNNAEEETYNQLLPCYAIAKGCEGYDPLVIQVTKFSCGGITIGVAFFHSVCDGVGIAQFMRTVIELASGKTRPTVLPVWERERLTFNNIKDKLQEGYQIPKLDISPIATSPYIPTDNMVRETINISSEYITKIKKIVEEDNKDMSVTTLEIVAALMWKGKCRALKLNQEGDTIFAMSVGIRGITEPPLPEGYYGNAVYNVASNAMTVKELNESTLSHVVGLIKDMKKTALDKRYMSAKLREIETRMGETATYEGYNAGYMSLTDLRNIGLEIDGWRGLVNIIPIIHMPFLSILLPPSKLDPGKTGAEGGGVRLLVTLPRDAMAKFKEEINVF